MKKFVQLFLFVTLFVVSQKSYAQVTEQDSSALVAFYNATDGASWTNNTNWLTGQVSTWSGITVIDGRVYTMELPNNNITGNISTNIGNLTGLRNLILNDNNLTGEIPNEIGLLTELGVLILSNNQMTGDLPSGIENLDLSNLSLDHNKFTGSIPDAIGTWEVLYNLHLNDNQFTDLPTLPGLPEGTVVRVENNRFEFDDLEPNINILTSYSPQDSIGVASEESLNKGDQLMLTITTGGDQNTYKWYKDNVLLTGHTSATLTVPTVDNSDAGIYRAEVKNTIVQNLTLVSRSTTIKVKNLALQADSLALIALYNATDGSNWSNKTNWLNDPLSTWFGVTVTNGRVTDLDLHGNGLKGDIATEIGQLTNLRTLDLSDNRLTGPIPPEIGNFTNLSKLFLHNNPLIGELPATIGQLTNLDELVLFNTQLTGNLPAELGQLTQLTNLILSRNQFVGEIPAELGQLTNLTLLALNNNRLTGTVPAVLRQLTNLDFLNLSRNQFTALPPQSGLPEWASIQVENNLLEFDDLEPHVGIENFTYAPQGNIGATKTYTVMLGAPQINLTVSTGGSQKVYRWYKDETIIEFETGPTLEVGNVRWSPDISDIYSVDAGVYHASVTSSLVPDLTLYYHPQTVHVVNPPPGPVTDSLALIAIYKATRGHAWVKSEISFENNNTFLHCIYKCWTRNRIADWSGVTLVDGRVTELSLRDQDMYGVLPPEIGLLTELQVLDLFSNETITDIPAELGQLAKLQVLNLMYTRLSWKLPTIISQIISRLTNLRVLKFTRSGGARAGVVIPPEIGRLTNLVELNLSKHGFIGAMPPEIGLLSNLRILNLFNNLLEGAVPPEIGQLRNLESLDIGWNNLTSLPPEIGLLSNLRVLDADENELGGMLPEISLLSNLETLDLRSNRIKFLPPEIGQLTSLELLDLGGNNFTESLPAELGQLTSLKVLRLSQNSFPGTLPAELGKLTNLQVLEITNTAWENGPKLNLVATWLSLRELYGSNSGIGSGRYGGESGVGNLSKHQLLVIDDIPPEIGNLTNLEVLILGDNIITGELPPEIGKLSKLKLLDIGHNQLSGSLPEEIGNLVSLDTLSLGNNNFSGEMPLSMTNLTNLAFFNFDSTQLVVPNDTSFQNWLVNIPDSIATSIDIEDSKNIIPSEYLLEQNYPNPFNPTTTIQYSIPNVNSGLSQRNVQLKIYDLLGREVVELVNENQSPGNYEARFDASNLTSGIYFYRLQAGSFTEIKKMILMK